MSEQAPEMCGHEGFGPCEAPPLRRQLAQAKARNAELERVVDRVLALVELAKCPLPVTGQNELISVAVPFRFLNDFYELREAAEAKVKP